MIPHVRWANVGPRVVIGLMMAIPLLIAALYAFGLAEIHYTVFEENQPLTNPQRVVSVSNGVGVLDDGRRVLANFVDVRAGELVEVHATHADPGGVILATIFKRGEIQPKPALPAWAPSNESSALVRIPLLPIHTARYAAIGHASLRAWRTFDSPVKRSTGFLIPVDLAGVNGRPVHRNY